MPINAETEEDAEIYQNRVNSNVFVPRGSPATFAKRISTNATEIPAPTTDSVKIIPEDSDAFVNRVSPAEIATRTSMNAKLLLVATEALVSIKSTVSPVLVLRVSPVQLAKLTSTTAKIIPAETTEFAPIKSTGSNAHVRPHLWERLVTNRMTRALRIRVPMEDNA